MNKKNYISPATIAVSMEAESLMSGSLREDGNTGTFGGGYKGGDAGEALVGNKRYFDTWSDDNAAE